jgi:hypothetical protein
MRIRDVYPGSEFFHPESRIQGQKGTGSRIPGQKDTGFRFLIRNKEYKAFLTQTIFTKLMQI